MENILFKFLLFFEILFAKLFSSCYSFQPSTFVFNSFAQCPDSEKNLMHFNGTITNIGRNKHELNGDFITHEMIAAPLEVNG